MEHQSKIVFFHSVDQFLEQGQESDITCTGECILFDINARSLAENDAAPGSYLYKSGTEASPLRVTTCLVRVNLPGFRRFCFIARSATFRRTSETALTKRYNQ